MQPAIASEIMPVRRDLRFELPVDRARDWHAQGSHVTQFFNALSLQFPDGERFFIDSVRYYRDQIGDPVLRKQVQGFIGQEAMHTREHFEYNELLREHGVQVDRIYRRVASVFAFYRRRLSPALQLALTMAAEHHTAMLANWLLSNPDFFKDSQENYRQVWAWHALEETEHKSVAFDVWTTVMKPGLRTYLMRVGAYLWTSLGFWSAQCLLHAGLMFTDRRYSNRHLRGVWRTLRLLFAPRRGIFPFCFSEFLAFFRPDFHPWDYDNRHFLEQVAEIGASYMARPVAPLRRGRGAAVNS